MAPVSRPSKVLVKEEKKNDDSMELPAYSAENIQHNMRIIYYSRTFLSIVGGVIAGVLGLSAISGFLCYFIIMLLVSAGIAAKTKLDLFSYFDSWQRITVDGITAGFMSFVLFWTNSGFFGLGSLGTGQSGVFHGIVLSRIYADHLSWFLPEAGESSIMYVNEVHTSLQM